MFWGNDHKKELPLSYKKYYIRKEVGFIMLSAKDARNQAVSGSIKELEAAIEQAVREGKCFISLESFDGLVIDETVETHFENLGYKVNSEEITW